MIMKRHSQIAASIGASIFPYGCEKSEATIVTTDSFSNGLLLFGITCNLAAYNESQVFYLSTRAGLSSAMPIQFSVFSMKEGLSATPELWNVTYDGRSATIISRYKARGIEDCGTSGTWRRVGTLFELLLFREKSECDGEMNEWPVVFRK